MSDEGFGAGGAASALIAVGFRRQPRRAFSAYHRMRGGEVSGERFGVVRHDLSESQASAIASEISS